MNNESAAKVILFIVPAPNPDKPELKIENGKWKMENGKLALFDFLLNFCHFAQDYGGKELSTNKLHKIAAEFLLSGGVKKPQE